MKNTIFIALSVLFCGLKSIGQTPSWNFAAGGNSIAEAFGTTSDREGNFYVTGYYTGLLELGGISVESAGGKDVFYAKFNAAGTLQWVKSAGGPEDDEGWSVIVDSNLNVFINGRFHGTAQFGGSTVISNGMQDVFLLKADSNGNTIWLKNGGGPYEEYVLQNSIAFNKYGNILMTGSYGGMTDSLGTSTFGAIHLNAYYPGGSDIFMAVYDYENGNVLSAKSAGGYRNDFGGSVSSDGADNLYTGMVSSWTTHFDNDTVLCPISENGIYIVKYNDSNEVRWVNSIYLSGFGDIGASGCTDRDGNAYLCGTFYMAQLMVNETVVATHPVPSLETGQDIFVSKFDSTGNHAWTLVLGGISYDIGEAISVDSLLNVYITGSYYWYVKFGPDTLLSDGDPDVFVAKYDKDGNFQWVLSGSGSGFSEGTSIAVSPSGNEIYLAGRYSGPFTLGGYSFEGPATGTDMFVARISQPLSVGSSPQAQPTVTISPNPGSGQVKVSFETGSFSELSLKDMAGRTVYQTAIPAGVAALYPDVSQLPNGVYLLQLKGSKGAYTQKLIVQH